MRVVTEVIELTICGDCIDVEHGATDGIDSERLKWLQVARAELGIIGLSYLGQPGSKFYGEPHSVCNWICGICKSDDLGPRWDVMGLRQAQHRI